ncbi:MAG: class B sortase [Butyrivibrio sp.]|nr:class B sortase [Butyrivibrio sp.]
MRPKFCYRAISAVITLLLLAGTLSGCSGEKEEEELSVDETLKIVRETNEDIFGWIYVPGTSINGPLLQNKDGEDDFYLYHNYLKEFDTDGAVFIESANLPDMTDFNEIIYGKPNSSTGFIDLYSFEDKDFFDQHDTMYIYLDGNALTYVIFMVYERENNNILEKYDLTYASGCQQFIDEINTTKSMNKHVREGWENMIETNNFIVTLTAVDDSSDKQLVVMGCLVGDAAGTIDRWFDVE